MPEAPLVRGLDGIPAGWATGCGSFQRSGSWGCRRCGERAWGYCAVLETMGRSCPMKRHPLGQGGRDVLHLNPQP
eukprot:CAMPEP_0184294776 /NCGR_PEP_ID=MMETSP1049-20130417/5877_1 /TAXON_ID=77928 /ORGANISM="Proteomonas sulcata, Strain CCMP704" /LENGTH=74 /DNA_ID=CAMNT_0026603167 /DNA_START=91 /DNA_END=315 /DNA_ORIENTATION=+